MDPLPLCWSRHPGAGAQDLAGRTGDAVDQRQGRLLQAGRPEELGPTLEGSFARVMSERVARVLGFQQRFSAFHFSA